MENKDKILLFIPMYNCEKQIVRVLSQLKNELSEYISEVIIVNNLSTDNGEEAVIDFIKNKSITIPISLLRNDNNYNLGGSHKVAFSYAIKNCFDYVITLHGDDQGSIKDFLPILRSQNYRNFDCCLGARFMKGSKLVGYNKIRIIGNYLFNFLFSLVCNYKVNDLGSGLNMYKTEMLKSKFYLKFSDRLFFNNTMILAIKYYKQKVLFVPITWKEEDQVSNNKLVDFSKSLFYMLMNFAINNRRYMENEHRDSIISHYTFQVIYSNIKI